MLRAFHENVVISTNSWRVWVNFPFYVKIMCRFENGEIFWKNRRTNEI